VGSLVQGEDILDKVNWYKFDWENRMKMDKESILSSPLFLNHPHCAVGLSHESDWAEPLGDVDTLGGASSLVFRMCVGP